jgi:uncharacterized hydantoinase/oxoprolinase family protein
MSPNASFKISKFISVAILEDSVVFSNNDCLVVVMQLLLIAAAAYEQPDTNGPDRYGCDSLAGKGMSHHHNLQRVSKKFNSDWRTKKIPKGRI